jgi:hypothetical protein
MSALTDAIAERKCDEFIELSTKIWQAGLCWPGETAFANALADFLPGDNGAIWPVRPSQMSPADAFEYIEARFGPLFVGFAKAQPAFTVH